MNSADSEVLDIKPDQIQGPVLPRSAFWQPMPGDPVDVHALPTTHDAVEVKVPASKAQAVLAELRKMAQNGGTFKILTVKPPDIFYPATYPDTYPGPPSIRTRECTCPFVLHRSVPTGPTFLHIRKRHRNA